MARMPPAEFDVTPELVRALLTAQHPDLLTDRKVEAFANGWDNAMLRLGDDLLVRLPRRSLAAELVEHEQAWLPQLASRLPAAIPAPVRTGQPGAGYPWSWSVLPWLPGAPLSALALDRRHAVAADLGAFLAALHTPAPADVWRSPYRGGTLKERTATVVARIRTHAGAAAPMLTAAWDEVITMPDPQVGLWVHGDVHPLNLLVDADRLAAVIDWGDLSRGDPACDLAIAWLGFDPDDAVRFREVYDAQAAHGLQLDALWARAHAWAIHLTMLILDGTDDQPELTAIGRHGLRRLEA